MINSDEKEKNSSACCLYLIDVRAPSEGVIRVNVKRNKVTLRSTNCKECTLCILVN